MQRERATCFAACIFSLRITDSGLILECTVKKVSPNQLELVRMAALEQTFIYLKP